jgi:regulator of sigma E protease
MAIILFSFVYASIGVPDSDKTIIANVIANSPADVIGLESGDLIVAIDGHQVRGKSDVLDIVLQNSNDYYLVDVLRDGSEYSFEVTKRDKIPVGEGPLGIQISNPVRRVSIFQSLAGGVITAYEQIHYTISVPFLIANGDITADEARPVGPVGIYDLFDQVKNEDALALSDADSSLGVIWFLAAISLAIGVTNLLPIPALDGGQILLTLPELFVGKKIPIRAVKVINATGFALLMALLVYVTFQDFFHLIP